MDVLDTALAFLEKTGKVYFAAFCASGAVVLLCLYPVKAVVGIPYAEGMADIVCAVAGVLVTLSILSWLVNKISSCVTRGSAERKQKEQRRAEVEVAQQKASHFLERTNDTEKLLLAWLVKENRDHFSFNHLSEAVTSLTNKGILITSASVDHYRDVPKFILDRLMKMDELKKIRIPTNTKDLPWMYTSSFY